MPPVVRRAMLQNLSKEICECLLRAEQCKRPAESALAEAAKAGYLDTTLACCAVAAIQPMTSSPQAAADTLDDIQSAARQD